MYNIKTYIKFSDGCQIGNRIYFVNMTFNAICYLDITKLTIHFVSRISHENNSAVALSTGLNFLHNNTIYFLPNNTKEIIKYDIAKQKNTRIVIPDFEIADFQTIAQMRLRNKIFIFPFNLGKGVYVFDILNEKVKRDDELTRLFGLNVFCANVCLVQDARVVIGLSGSNYLIELDLEKKDIIKKTMLPKHIKIENLCFDGVHYWILQRESTDIYELGREYEVLHKYVNINVEWNSREYTVSAPYSELIFLKDETLVLNCCLKNILRINKEKRTIEDAVNFPESFQLINKNFSGWPICYGNKVIKNKVFLFPCRGNMLLIYDIYKKKLTGKEVMVSKEDVLYLEDVVEEIFLNNKVNTEMDDLGSLKNYIYMIGKIKKKQLQNYGLAGKKIFNRMKEI